MDMPGSGHTISTERGWGWPPVTSTQPPARPGTRAEVSRAEAREEAAISTHGVDTGDILKPYNTEPYITHGNNEIRI